jgi:adenylate cyclase
MARLVMQLPGGRFREHELERTTRIGRQPDQDLQILDPLVSKEHLVVEQIADAWYLRDLDSRNGTWVNNERVQGRVRLNHDDRVKLGSTHLVFTARQDRKQTATPPSRVGLARNEAHEVPIYRESPEDFLPVDLVPDEATLKRDYEKLRLAHRLHREVAFDLKIELVLPRILDHLFALFKADRGVIMLVSADGALVPRAMAGHGRDSDDEPIQLSQTIVNTVLEKRTAMLTRDAQIDRRFQHAQSIIMQGIRSSMCAPLLGRSRDVIGIIHLDSLLAANAFTERDLSMFLAIASEAAIAIENAHLLERHEHAATEREALRRFLPPALVARSLAGELQVPRDLSAGDVTALWALVRPAPALALAAGTSPSIAFAAATARSAFLDGLVRVVHEHGGTVAHLSFDGLLALWGAPTLAPNGDSDAITCAVALQQAAEGGAQTTPRSLGAMLASGGTSPVDLAEPGAQTMLLGSGPAFELRVGVERGAAFVGTIAPSTCGAFSAAGTAIDNARTLAEQAAPGEILTSTALAASASNGLAEAGSFEPSAILIEADGLEAWRFNPAPRFEEAVRTGRERTLQRTDQSLSAVSPFISAPERLALRPLSDDEASGAPVRGAATELGPPSPAEPTLERPAFRLEADGTLSPDD